MTAAVLAYATALFLFVRANLDDPSTDLGAGATSSGPSFPAEPTVTNPGTGARPSDSPGTVVVTDTLPDTTITATEPGGIAIQGLTPHHLVVRVASRHSIARLGYVIPTSLDHSTGDLRNVASPFVLNTEVYGKPKYAEVFIQTGRDGAPVSCTIEVDGAVTSTETTSGTYGRQLCIG